MRDLLDRGLQAIAIQGGGEAALALVGAAAGLAALGMAAKENPFASAPQVWLPEGVDFFLDVRALVDDLNGRFPRSDNPGLRADTELWRAARLRALGLSDDRAAKFAKTWSRETASVLVDLLLEDGNAAGEALAYELSNVPYMLMDQSNYGCRVFLLPSNKDWPERPDAVQMTPRQFLHAVVGAMDPAKRPKYARKQRKESPSEWSMRWRASRPLGYVEIRKPHDA